MHDLTTFEQRFGERLERELGRSSDAAFDAALIAERAIAARRSLWDGLLNGLGAGLALPMRVSRQPALLAFLALVVLAIVALAVGVSRLGGPRLAFVRTDGAVVVANADGTDQRVIGHASISPLRNDLDWAPDGGHLAMFGDDWQLVVLGRDGTVASARKLEDRYSRFAWSPDGTQIAVFDGGWRGEGNPDGPPLVAPHLDVIDLDGGVAWSATLPADFRYLLGSGHVAWSPDGHTIAITGVLLGDGVPDQRSSIWLVAVGSGTVRPLLDSSRRFDDQPTWLPDGRLVFARLNDGLWQADVASATASRLLDVALPPCDVQCGQPQHVTILGLSPDGSRLAYSAAGVGVSVLDLMSGHVSSPAEPELPVRALPPAVWSSDGRAFLVLTGEVVTPIPPAPRPDRITRIDIETGEVTIIASGVVAFDVRW
jgi:hypothetical protein